MIRSRLALAADGVLNFGWGEIRGRDGATGGTTQL